MKINDMQKLLLALPIARYASKVVDQEGARVIPGYGSAGFLTMLEALGQDLIAIALTCDKLGITVEYLVEHTISIANAETITFTEQEKTDGHN